MPLAPVLLRMRSALVFGASGQIGAALCERLRIAGWSVTAVSRHRRVAPDAGADTVQWLQADLSAAAQWPKQAEVVFSCGPLDLFSLWYAGNAQLRCPRVVAFGSTSADVKHDSPEAAERSLSRLLRDSEARVFAAAASRAAQATVLRPTLVYGAGRDQTLSSIARIARRTGWFVLPAGATGLRQPVHVEDLAWAAQAVVDAPQTHGRTFALPGGETLPYRDMVKRTLASLQPPSRLLEVPAPLFRAALAGARMTGRLKGASTAALGRMRQDLVFDANPAAADFGYAPRGFDPAADAFIR